MTTKTCPETDVEPEGGSRPTWTLTPADFTATVERAAKINARAAKRGFTGRIEVAGTEREVTETDASGLELTRVVVDTQITGEAPCYNGWQFLAAVDTVETEDGPDFVLRTAPGVEESGVDRSTLKPGHCEHCKSSRANRRFTYLVRHVDTGETLQVGSTCIKDFTGWAGKPVFISEEDLAGELDEFIGDFRGRGCAEYTPETIVALAWTISRVHGWVAASAAYCGPSTRDLVTAYLYGTSPADADLRREVAPAMAEAQATAKGIIPALLEGLEGDGDYVVNLKTLLRARSVDSRHMGIVVSAVSAYERMVGSRVRKEAQAKAQAESQWAGNVEEKIEVAGTVTRLVPVESSYGYTTTTSMLVIVEGGSTVAKMVTAAAWAFEVEQGDDVVIAGTVKAHEEYNGTKQTVLSRPKLLARSSGDQTAAGAAVFLRRMRPDRCR